MPPTLPGLPPSGGRSGQLWARWRRAPPVALESGSGCRRRQRHEGAAAREPDEWPRKGNRRSLVEACAFVGRDGPGGTDRPDRTSQGAGVIQAQRQQGALLLAYGKAPRTLIRPPIAGVALGRRATRSALAFCSGYSIDTESRATYVYSTFRLNSVEIRHLRSCLPETAYS